MSTRKKPAKSGNYVAYYRVSDAKQEISGLGLEAQRSSVKRYLTGRSKTLIAEFTEVESGKKDKNRPQLIAALASARKNHATLLIAKLDRLARNVHFISGLMEASTDFVALDLPDANKLTIHIMAAMAEHEREMISERTKNGLAEVLREIKEKGFRISKTGRRCTQLGNPRWMESIAKARAAQRTPATVASELANRMEELRSQGLSLRAIAGRLNEASLRTPAGKEWYASTVRAVLNLKA
jgi:DNA invertase Pin-like site-specific DNA recombinase